MKLSTTYTRRSKPETCIIIGIKTTICTMYNYVHVESVDVTTKVATDFLLGGAGEESRGPGGTHICK